MNLVKAEARMLFLMNDLGLPAGWTFEWDRSVRRRGACHGHLRKITMSRRLTELATDEEAEQTMLHEIAHALVGAEHGHDSVWLAQARAIGYRGERTSKREQEVLSPLVAICPGCGHEYGRFRAPKRGARYSCGKCSKRGYDARYALVFTRRPVSA